MRIESLGARDLLSFVDFHLDVSDGLSVVVGPNGGGKTNLVRIVRLAIAAIKAVASSDFRQFEAEWAAAGRYASPYFEASVGLHFDQPGERSLIEDWGRSAVISALRGSAPSRGAWCDAQLPDDIGAADLLGRGVLVIRRDPLLHQGWDVTWQTSSPEAHLRLWNGMTLTAGRALSDGVVTTSRSEIWELLRSANRRLPSVSSTSSEEDLSRYKEVLGGFALANLFSDGISLELVARRAGIDPELLSMQRLEAGLGQRLDPHRDQVSFAELLDVLISRNLLMLENRRLPARRIVEVAELMGPAAVEDGSGVAVELLRLKTGDVADRDRYRLVQEVFAQISGSKLDVRQQVVGAGDETCRMLVVPVLVERRFPDDREIDIPLHLAGAGREEMALMALVLTDPRSTIVLDEPAASVSPVVQRRLLGALRRIRHDRQTLVITHSAHLVPSQEATDLATWTRIDRRGDASAPHRVEEETAADLFAESKGLLWGAEMRDLLFTAGVVLVEGPTELAALKVWLDNPDRLRGLPTPEVAHVAIVATGSDSAFAKHVRLMDAFGVPVVILADGPAFRPRGPLTKIPKAAPPAADPEAETFAEAANRWKGHRVRTLADTFGSGGDKAGEIEAFFAKTDREAWDQVCAEPDRGQKPDRGYRFAMRTPTPTAVVDVWEEILGELGLSSIIRMSIGLTTKASD